MIINVRGTSGSGKSHLARRLLAHYTHHVGNFREGARMPHSATYTGAPWSRGLFVLGHYEAGHGGGADTFSQRDPAFALMTEARDAGCDVFWEGMAWSDEVERTARLVRGHPHLVIRLSTPIETCLEAIRERRAERAALQGKPVEPLSEYNTRGRQASIARACGRLGTAGVRVRVLNREEAYGCIMEVLNAHSSTA